MSWCRECGAEHWLAAARCVQCGGHLSSTYVAPVVVPEPSHGVVGILVDQLDDAGRWRVEHELSSAGIPYQIDAGVLSVSDVHESAALGILNAARPLSAGDHGSTARAEPDIRFEVQVRPRESSLRRRLAAAFIDLVIVSIPVAIAMLPMYLELLAGDEGTLSTELSMLSIAGLVLQYGYLAVFTAMTGATIGKRVAGIRVVANDGGPVGWKVAINRYVGLLAMLSVGEIAELLGATDGISLSLGMIAPIVVYAPVAWSPTRGALHDRLSGTKVIRA